MAILFGNCIGTHWVIVCQGTVRVEGSLGCGDAPQGLAGQDLAAGIARSTSARDWGRRGAALGTSPRTGMGWGQAGNMSHDEKHVMGERECVARALTDVIELND